MDRINSVVPRQEKGQVNMPRGPFMGPGRGNLGVAKPPFPGAQILGSPAPSCSFVGLKAAQCPPQLQKNIPEKLKT